jgi:orotidine-5'-phosphate decarboxylase
VVQRQSPGKSKLFQHEHQITRRPDFSFEVQVQGIVIGANQEGNRRGIIGLDPELQRHEHQRFEFTQKFLGLTPGFRLRQGRIALKENDASNGQGDDGKQDKPGAPS